MMQLVSFTDPVLKQRSVEFDFNDPGDDPLDPIQLAKDLAKIMIDSNGINLAAVQVGIPRRVFVMRGIKENMACFNPRIVMLSDQTVRLEETSLTYPGLVVKVTRPSHCRVRFALPNGEVRTETYTGLTARVFQQSMDFLDGNLFYEGANRVHREQALRKWNIMQRKKNG